MNARDNKKIILLFDFDGTLTCKPGGQVVFTPFYKTLQTNPNEKYTATTLKPVEELHALMKAEFTQYEDENNQRDPRRVSLDALAFFNEVLAMPEVDIAIITRNQADYVRAMLKFEGVDITKVDQLPIFSFIPKDYAAAEFLKDYTPATIFGFDDSADDAKLIESGAKSVCKDVTVFNEKPGEFSWDQYLSIIKQKLKTPNPSAFFSSSQEPTGPNPESNNNDAELIKAQTGFGYGTG